MARDDTPIPAGKLPAPTNYRRYTAAYLADLETVFSGGYYIVLMDGEVLPLEYQKTKIQQARNKKQEEMLRQSNSTRMHLSAASGKDHPAHDVSDHPGREGINESVGKPVPTRHERLIEELQSLISKSDTMKVEHETHLKNELSIARSQLLKDGGVDDYDLMRTMHELATVQGFGLGGSMLAGRFVSDIMDAPEPLPSEIPTAQSSPFAADATTQEAGKATDAQDNDRTLYYEEFPQFSAYNIAEVGGYRHKSSYFFAKRLMTLLKGLNELSLPEQNSTEMLR